METYRCVSTDTKGKWEIREKRIVILKPTL